VNAVYRAVTGRIRREIQALSQVVARTLYVWGQAEIAPTDYYVDAAALDLHGFYAGLDWNFEIRISDFEIPLPKFAIRNPKKEISKFAIRNSK
jgi:hypothetical protein